MSLSVPPSGLHTQGPEGNIAETTHISRSPYCMEQLRPCTVLMGNFEEVVMTYSSMTAIVPDQEETLWRVVSAKSCLYFHLGDCNILEVVIC